MDNSLPAPLVPAECDLQDFAFMPVDVQRVLKSDTWVLASGEEKAAAMCLWLESWHQVPAASLPDNPRMLAHLAQTQKWAKLKEQALRGWVRCADGRLYHPVVAEKALEAWIEKLLAAISGASGNAKRWGLTINIDASMAQLKGAINMLRDLAPQSKTLKKKAVLAAAAGIAPGSPPDNKAVSPPDSPPDRNRQGQRQGQGLSSVPDGTGDAGAPPDGLTAHEAVFQIAVPWLVANGCKESNVRSLLGGAVKQLGDDGAWGLVSDCMREKPIEPVAWLAKSLNERMRIPAAGGRQSKQESLEERNRRVAEELSREVA